VPDCAYCCWKAWFCSATEAFCGSPEWPRAAQVLGRNWYRPPAPETEAPARDALAALLAVHLPRAPRSLEFLKKLREAARG